MGTKFTVYDQGIKWGSPGIATDRSNLREELASICYETNVLGFKVTMVLNDVCCQVASSGQTIDPCIYFYVVHQVDPRCGFSTRLVPSYLYYFKNMF